MTLNVGTAAGLNILSSGCIWIYIHVSQISVQSLNKLEDKIMIKACYKVHFLRFKRAYLVYMYVNHSGTSRRKRRLSSIVLYHILNDNSNFRCMSKICIFGKIPEQLFSEEWQWIQFILSKFNHITLNGTRCYTDIQYFKNIYNVQGTRDKKQRCECHTYKNRAYSIQVFYVLRFNTIIYRKF